MTAYSYTNLHKNISFKGYDRIQKDSMNTYALPVLCQKLMVENFKPYFIGWDFSTNGRVINKEIYKILQKTI